MVRKLIALAISILVLPLVFAQTVSVQIGGKVTEASFDYISKNGLYLTLYLSCSNCGSIIGNVGYLTLSVVYGQGKIVYQEIIPVTINSTIVLPYTIPGWVFSEEGKYNIQATYQANYGSSLLTSSDEFTVLVSNIKGKAFIVESIYPDITKDRIFTFDRAIKSFIVEIYNPLDYSQYVNIVFKLLDQQGNLVLSQSQQGMILPGQRGTLNLPINFLSVQPGKYKLVFTVFRGVFEELRIERDVIISEEQYLPIKVYSISNYPYTIKPGDYVEFRLLVRNLEEPAQIKVIANSTKLDLYKESDVIELDSNEVKEIRMVLKIPDNLEGGKYLITFSILSGIARRQYNYYIDVVSIKKEIPVQISFEGPSKLIVGNYSIANLVFRSNLENLMTYRVSVFAEGADVEYNDSVKIGGKGEEVKLPIKIKPLGKDVTLRIKVYDTNGNIVYETVEKYRAAIVLDLRYYIALALVSIAIILIIVILIMMLPIKGKGGKRRRVEEAE